MSLGRQTEPWPCSLFSAHGDEEKQKRPDANTFFLVTRVAAKRQERHSIAGGYELHELQGQGTCTEREEEELHLLAFWKQLNQVKLERNHVNALAKVFSCGHKGNHPLFLLI